MEELCKIAVITVPARTPATGVGELLKEQPHGGMGAQGGQGGFHTGQSGQNHSQSQQHTAGELDALPLYRQRKQKATAHQQRPQVVGGQPGQGGAGGGLAGEPEQMGGAGGADVGAHDNGGQLDGA